MGNMNTSTGLLGLHLESGYIHLAAERYSEAKGEFLVALDLDPDCSRAYCGLFLVSVRAASLEEVTNSFLIPRESELGVTKDDPEIIGDLDELCRRYEIEYFNTREDIEKCASIGGGSSRETSMIKWLEREKYRFLGIWNNDANLAMAMECGTLEEQYKISACRDHLVAKFDMEISRYAAIRRKSYENEIREIPTGLKESYECAQELAKSADGAIGNAERRLKTRDYRGAYTAAQPYERHPRAKKLMSDATCGEQKKLDFLNTGAALILALVYSLIVTLSAWVENPHWTHFPYFALFLFFAGFFGHRFLSRWLVGDSQRGFLGKVTFKERMLSYRIFSVVAAAIALCLTSVASTAYYGEVDSILVTATCVCLLPIAVTAVASLLGMKGWDGLVIIGASVLASLIFSGFPLSLFDSDFNVLESGSEYVMVVMPLLVSTVLVIAAYVLASLSGLRGYILAAAVTLAYQIMTLTVIGVDDGEISVPLVCIILFCMAMPITIYALIKIGRNADYQRPQNEWSVYSIHITQKFDYKRPKKPARGGVGDDSCYGGSSGGYSGGGWDDDDDSGSSSGGSSYDFGYLGGSDSDSSNNDAADYNARSMGYGSADDASSSLGINSKDLYY